MKQAFTLIMIVCFGNIAAQDVIVKKDGSTISSKVLEVNPSDIRYKKTSNLDGPIYTINKSELLSINYENGDIDLFKDGLTQNNGTLENIKYGIIDTVRNAELIALYNQDNHCNSNVVSSKKAKYAINFIHVDKESVLNNGDLEMSFIAPIDKTPGFDLYDGSFRIVLTNLTDNIIYIDLGNSFRVYSKKYETYYDNTMTQTSTGNSNGVGLNIGSVASVLGIGGAVGSLASGVTVGSSKQETTTEIKTKERIISIPPHASYIIEDGEYMEGRLNHNLSIGEEVIYSEDDSPFKKECIFTYSKDMKFESYRMIKASFFIAKQIGYKKYFSRSDGLFMISNDDSHTLWEGSY